MFCGALVSGDSSDATNVVGDAAPDGLHPFCVTTPGNFTFSTCGGATWDTHLRLFDQVPGGTELAENDDSCSTGYQYASTLTASLGVGCYVLAVEGFAPPSPPPLSPPPPLPPPEPPVQPFNEHCFPRADGLIDHYAAGPVSAVLYHSFDEAAGACLGNRDCDYILYAPGSDVAAYSLRGGASPYHINGSGFTVYGRANDYVCGPPPGYPSPPTCTNLDVMLVVDRSNSIGESKWRNYVAPAMYSIVQMLNPGTSTNNKMGMAVFPAQSGGSPGDSSGLAETRVGLTTSKSTLANMASDASSKCKDNFAKFKMRYPCSDWGYTSTWTGLQRAEEQLYPSGLSNPDGRQKIVLLLTDGAPSKGKNGPKHERPTYLTLAKAAELKAAGAKIYGVGYGNKFTSIGSPCSPLCTNDGEELFAGKYLGGSVYFSNADNSPLGSGPQVPPPPASRCPRPAPSRRARRAVCRGMAPDTRTRSSWTR